MAQLSVSLNDEEMEALAGIAARRDVAVSHLLEEYVSYLFAGGEPVDRSFIEPSAEALARLAEQGGSFDWLTEEPELYTVSDGECSGIRSLKLEQRAG